MYIDSTSMIVICIFINFRNLSRENWIILLQPHVLQHRCWRRIGPLKDIWILHSTPSRQVPAISSSNSYECFSPHWISLSQMLHELYIVHHSIFSCQIFDCWLFEGPFLIKWNALAEVSVFREHDECVPLVGQILGDKPRITILLPDISIVSHKEQNRS